MLIEYKRIYDYHKNDKDKSYTAYIDKLYPRGLSSSDTRITTWIKGLSPSNELMQWFHENRDKNWPDFSKKYYSELVHSYKYDEDFKKSVDKLAKHDDITLLYSSRDERHNNARVFARFLYNIKTDKI